METNQFADVSKDLYAQVKAIENLMKSDSYKEASKKLTTVEKACDNLESLMTPDNRIQRNIVSNRRQEIVWIQDAIRLGMAKAKAKVVKNRVPKAKKS